ncbi:MAG: response regulator transcription factor [Anaerolineae bacterium]
MSSEAEARNAGVARPSGTPPPGILVIDDDENLTRLLRESLEEAGYDVLSAGNGVDGMRELYAGRPDLVVLDVMMPRLDGWATLSRIREMSDVPVVMLSARDAESDRLRGFELGVDDYVTKPFSLRELNARIRAVLTRAAQGAASAGTPPLTVADLVIDFASRRVLKGGEPVQLTPTEYRLLATLGESFGRTVSHEQLLEAAWGPEYLDEPGYVKRYIWYLRQKIEDNPSQPRYVETVRGFGYRLRKDTAS